MEENEDKKQDKTGQEMLSGMGGIFEGVSHLLGRLGELAEKGQELKKTSQFRTSSGKDANASYGFSVKFASDNLTGSETNVQPIKKSAGGKSQISPVAKRPEDREPQVDLFDESDHVSIVAEMPGVTIESISIEFNGNLMSLAGTTPRVRFIKTIALPQAFGPDDLSVEVNNGVVEIRLRKSPQ